MDDFNNNNTNNINNQNGELNGFDSVNGNDTAQNGYTVTPDGGFYTKRRDDIIQDEAYGSNYENKDKAEAKEPPHNFYPNGEYGAQNYNYAYKPP